MDELAITETNMLDKAKSEIYKTNALIESSERLTLNEHRLIIFAASRIKHKILTGLSKDKLEEELAKLPKSFRFGLIKISVDEFAEFYNLDKNALYSELAQATKRLYSRNVYFKEISKRGQPVKVEKRWVITSKYSVNEGYVEMEFHPDLIYDLLIIKTAFTPISLAAMRGIRSSYTYALYQLLKVKVRLGSWEFWVEDLKEKLGIKINEYPQFGSIKKKILTPAVLEINEKTDLEVSYIVIKDKKKIIKVRFYIKSKSAELDAEAEIPSDTDLEIVELIELLKTHPQAKNIKVEDVKALMNVAEGDKSKIKEAFQYAMKQAIRSNLIGYLRKAIIGNYAYEEVPQIKMDEVEFKVEDAIVIKNIYYFKDLDDKECLALYKEAHGDIDLVNVIAAIMQKRNNINDIVAFARAGIRDGYKMGKRSPIAGESSKRHYDAGELERLMFGRDVYVPTAEEKIAEDAKRKADTLKLLEDRRLAETNKIAGTLEDKVEAAVNVALEVERAHTEASVASEAVIDEDSMLDFIYNTFGSDKAEEVLIKNSIEIAHKMALRRSKNA